MLDNFVLFARPWWVNLLIIIPFAAYYFWWNKLDVSKKTLLVAGIFGLAFGFVETAVVVYLRSLGYLPGSVAAVAYIHRSGTLYLSKNFLAIEAVRNAATIVMLICVALLAEKNRRERWAVFLWTFAFWDLFYYFGLYLLIGWPKSLTTPDVLFLIPSPWYSQVWFPLLVSGLTVLAVLAGRRKRE
ncbi:MAG: hypothetical protein P4L62_03940 [Candidatus Pacebacteria bacterium]|nr:hypothetical protein [Candidatus Paceibacterota bacterium]